MIPSPKTFYIRITLTHELRLIFLDKEKIHNVNTSFLTEKLELKEMRDFIQENRNRRKSVFAFPVKVFNSEVVGR